MNCKNASSGCNYPESECIGLCMKHSLNAPNAENQPKDNQNQEKPLQWAPVPKKETA